MSVIQYNPQTSLKIHSLMDLAIFRTSCDRNPDADACDSDPDLPIGLSPMKPGSSTVKFSSSAWLATEVCLSILYMQIILLDIIGTR